MFEDRISIDSDVMVGKPVIKGTRITVELILEKLAHGQTHVDIIGSHPRLTEDDIRAALAYAVRTIALEDVYPNTKKAA